MHKRGKRRKRNELGIFYIVCGSRIGLLELGGFCCLERKDNGMGIRIYYAGIGCIFLFFLPVMAVIVSRQHKYVFSGILHVCREHLVLV